MEPIKGNFARLHDTEAFGQVLVTVDTDDSTGYPILTIRMVSPEGLGLSTNIGFKESADYESAWDRAEAALDKADHDWCLEYATLLYKQVMTTAGRVQ